VLRAQTRGARSSILESFCLRRHFIDTLNHFVRETVQITKNKRMTTSTTKAIRVTSATEELLGRKSSGSGLERREYGRRDPSR
jgi:hypothetical protein